MKRTKRVLGLALAAVMCMGMLAGCGGTKRDAAIHKRNRNERKGLKHRHDWRNNNPFAPLYDCG